ncbi:sacsin N-terminal ATP-binding-like domain-containing protein [Geomonas subterranea]|uniref:sacsin N-terminal ATP-binding-like domain-containing protein n=1 Tax=Geomonas subterranea TaxID=2847989 RepID=UPI001CD5E88C|nr:hypothetical protein [Geomonas fuzhouensis]
MDIIEEVRREREDLARVLKRHRGIRRVVEELYPDSAHFIYELLQNAEDTGATEADFLLSNDELVFDHNGRPFEPRDIYAITDIGEGTKANDDEQIGRFGVGFKAVFAYSETPHIWSPTYSFKITDLVLPTPVAPDSAAGLKTRFKFPFNNPKKKPEAAYAEVEAGLWALAETTLLFLSHLCRIRWVVGGMCGEVERIQHSKDHLEVLKKRNRQTVSSSHFLRFDEPVKNLGKQRMAIAFALEFLPGIQRFDQQAPLAAQLKVAPATPGQVAVFFPAEKENSGLRFHLHAPFVPELSRASIKETPANLPLFEQIAALAARSLHRVRDLGLLTVEFLASLPNPHDILPQRYNGIRDAIIEEMNHQPLTPTYAKSHSPAKYLLQGKASLKELLNDTDLKFLVDNDIPHHWAITAPQRNSNADRFLMGLAITEWDVEAFVGLLDDKACGWYGEPDEEFMTWLGAKSLDWHQQLYAFLFRELEQELHWPLFDEVKIIRLADGNYLNGSACYFPGDDTAEYDDILPRVDRYVYSSGKSKIQQENAKRFLQKSGVREVGDLEQVKALLARRYEEGENFNPKKEDLRRFVSLVENEAEHSALFQSYFIFEGEDGYWRKPGQVFIDSPLRDTGLREYYSVTNPLEICALAARYQNCCVSTSRLIKFAELVGAQTCINITPVSCCKNPQWSYLCSVGGERYTSPIDEDYTITGLEQLLAKRTVAASRLVWRTMCELPPSRLRARFRRNLSNGSHYADSQLVHILRAAAWVPQISGAFVCPTAASRELLPEGFPFDSGWEWLKCVHFGQDAAKKSEEQRQKLAAAKNLGFPDSESLERAKRFILLPPEEQERILLDLECRAARELPESEPPNPKRRAERVSAEATEAPERRSEVRTRSVSSGLDAVKQEALQYLRSQYTNSDGDVICQACKSLMPFKLDDGSDYFEKVEFLPDLQKRYYQNYLALCPNHAAMFQHANGSTNSLREMFSKVSGNELEIVLAHQEASIYFTKTHIADLKCLISADETQRAGLDRKLDQ